MKKTKITHILLIIFGIILILIPAFHTNIWFDESYTIAITNKSFSEIWQITGHDVHPALYYWMIHIIYLIFGSNILIYRLFSILGVSLLGILGYTHIRKDFGEKTGILFSFFTFFLPIMSTYGQEIRMYSWSCLIVTLMAIYGYRFYKSLKNKEEKNSIKNMCLFGIFSIMSCYIHYYALVTAGIINLIILIYLIKTHKENKKALRNFLILAVIQIILYIPWLIYFIAQLKHVGGGYWIQIGLISTTVDVISFQFKSQFTNYFEFNIQTIIALISSLAIYIYIGIKLYKYTKQKENTMPVLLSILIYISVIAVVGIVSIKSPILYARYLMVMTGLYIFILAYTISKEKNKIIIGIILGITFILAISSCIQNSIINYDKSNKEVYNYINEEIKPDDILIYSNVENGGVTAATFQNNKQYFMNLDKWDVKEAYKAYLPAMETVENFDFLKEYKGRIWVIDDGDMSLYNKEEFVKDNIEIIKEAKKFNVKYHNYTYNIILLEKN